MRDVEAPWHMHSEKMSRENFRCASIRRPAVIADAALCEFRARLLRVANAVHIQRHAEVAHRLQHVVAQFLAAFPITPVANPNGPCSILRKVRWMKQCRVGRLMPGKDTVAPSVAAIGFAEGLAKCQDAVIGGEIVAGHGIGLADHAVMRIVKQ